MLWGLEDATCVLVRRGICLVPNTLPSHVRRYVHGEGKGDTEAFARDLMSNGNSVESQYSCNRPHRAPRRTCRSQ